MPERFEDCIYCGMQVRVREGAQQILCGTCGKIMKITQFQNEYDKLQRLEQNEVLMNARVAAAEQAEKLAKEQLQTAVSCLEGLKDGQTDAVRQLDRIIHAQTDEDTVLRQLLDTSMTGNRQQLQALKQDKAIQETLRESMANQEGIKTLLTSILGNQKTAADSSNAMNAMLDVLILEQQNGNNSLATIRQIAGDLLNAQSAGARQLEKAQQSIKDQLKGISSDAREQRRLLDNFIAWSSTIRQEDVSRLKALSSSVDTIHQTQLDIASTLGPIKAELNTIHQQLTDFTAKYDRQKQQRINALYRQANTELRTHRFDDAKRHYLQAVIEGGDDVETRWRIMLAHYGVEFVKSESEKRLVPTMYRPDLTEPENLPERIELRKALNTVTDPTLRNTYYTTLQAIDEILGNYRALQYDHHYDVFICVKQSDANGNATKDRQIGLNLYYTFEKWGLKCFNSQVPGLIPFGESYEPHIISALISSTVMVVVGTNRAYMESKWVQNEWRRFQWFMKHQPEKKRKLMCFLAGDIGVKDIPSGLNQDIQHIHFNPGTDNTSIMRDQFRAIFGDRIKDPNSGPSTEELQEKIGWALADGRFNDASEMLKNIERIKLTALLILYKVCASNRLPDVDTLVESSLDLSNIPQVKFGRKRISAEEQAKLDDYIRKNADYRAALLEKQQRRAAEVQRQKDEADRKKREEEARRIKEEQQKRQQQETARLQAEQEKQQRETEKRRKEEEQRRREEEQRRKEEKERQLENERIRKKLQEIGIQLSNMSSSPLPDTAGIAKNVGSAYALAKDRAESLSDIQKTLFSLTPGNDRDRLLNQARSMERDTRLKISSIRAEQTQVIKKAQMLLNGADTMVSNCPRETVQNLYGMIATVKADLKNAGCEDRTLYDKCEELLNKLRKR